MTLSEKQRLFTFLIQQFVNYAYRSGYELTYGMAERTNEEQDRLFNAGKSKLRGGQSNHNRRLAVDFNLYKDGKYMTSTEDWEELGAWWKQQHPLCRWGGDWGDGNHLSLEHDGFK